jgi:hypothetical protein
MGAAEDRIQRGLELKVKPPVEASRDEAPT